MHAQVIDQWKLDLVRRIARHRHFRAEELKDAQQQVIPLLLTFQYDPARSNGLTEQEALTFFIRKALAQLQRSEIRRRKHEDGAKLAFGEVTAECLVNRTALTLDVQTAVKSLPHREQAICKALADETPRCLIAKHFHMSRHELAQTVHKIAERFSALALDSWVQK